MRLPELTHIQFFVLGELLDGEVSGAELRERLAHVGQRKSAPAFYQLMARLEDAKLVKGRYETIMVGGVPLKQRRYTITGGGRRSVEATEGFYRSRAAARVGAPAFA